MTASPAQEARSDLFDILARSAEGSAAVFSEPWMARTFGLTMVLSEKSLFSLKDFQAALIDAVGSQEQKGCISDDVEYYTCWLEALLGLLRRRPLIPQAAISEQALSIIEQALVAEAAARKEHQHQLARNPDGSLKIAPIIVS